MPQLEQILRQLAHAALIIQPHVIILFPLIEVAVHKNDGLAGHLHQLAALIGLQPHNNQPDGIPRLGNPVNLRRGLGRSKHGIVAAAANRVFSSAAIISLTNGSASASFSSRLG